MIKYAELHMTRTGDYTTGSNQNAIQIRVAIEVDGRMRVTTVKYRGQTHTPAHRFYLTDRRIGREEVLAWLKTQCPNDQELGRQPQPANLQFASPIEKALFEAWQAGAQGRPYDQAGYREVAKHLENRIAAGALLVQ